MYADFFGFRELPFNNTPDPRFFFSTPDHEEALASLIYAVKERKGFVLLTGEVGAGKTLVTRMMLRQFGAQIMFANINHAVQSADDLMESICTEFELPVEQDVGGTQLVRILHDYLLTQFAQNLPVVLVLDEAQNLSIEGFERLRMIGNLESDDAKLLQIAIVGQPELQRMFLSPKLRQLRQRLFRSFHLPSLNRGATEAYIRHRLNVVTDHPEEIFEPEALEAIFSASRGLPRLINTVCDNALLSAYSADRRTIDAAFVESVVAQMMLAGDVPSSGVGHNTPAQPNRSSDHSTAVTPIADPGLTSPGSTWTEAIAGRVAALEAQLHAATSTLSGPATQPVMPQVGDAPGTIGADIATLKRDLGWRVADTLRRLQAVEAHIQANHSDETNTVRTQGTLMSAVNDAKSCTKRAEVTIGELERREITVRKLSDNMANVVTELRKLVRSVSTETTKANDAVRSARILHERLARQSQRSRELVGELSHHAFAAAAHLPPRVSDGRPRTDVNASAEDTQPTRAIEPPKSNKDHRVRRRLAGVQESLSELRELARDPVLDDRSVTRSDLQPTDRLASQVESLLGMIASDGRPNKRPGTLRAHATEPVPAP